MVGTSSAFALRATADKEPYECEPLQRFIIIACVIVLRRGDIAVLVVVIFGRRTLRLHRFILHRFRRFVFPACSAHVMPFSSDESTLLCMPIRSIGMISIRLSLAGMLAPVTRIYLPFLRRSVQKGLHTEQA